jgi:hypothetical protein
MACQSIDMGNLSRPLLRQRQPTRAIRETASPSRVFRLLWACLLLDVILLTELLSSSLMSFISRAGDWHHNLLYGKSKISFIRLGLPVSCPWRNYFTRCADAP